MMRAIGALGHLQLAEDHRPRLLQARHDGRVPRRHVGAMDGHPRRGRDLRRVAEILYGDRHAMQRPARRARSGLGIEARGIGQAPGRRSRSRSS